MLDVGEGRVERGEGATRGRGDSGRLHHVLGERLGRLDAGGAAVGAEHGATSRAQRVGQASSEGRLRPDDREVDAVLLHRLQNLPDLYSFYTQIRPQLRGAGGTGSGEQVGGGGIAVERPAERVLAAA